MTGRRHDSKHGIEQHDTRVKKKRIKISKGISDLFSEQLWKIDISSCSKWYARLVSLVRLIKITMDSFTRNHMGFQCVALSYFVLLALVPLIGLTFAVTGGLGLSNVITAVLYKIFPANPEFVELLIEKASGIIEGAKGGGTGLISALMFLWAIIWMMFQVERVFNNIWNIRKIPRKLYKRLGFYILVILLLPFIVLTFGAGIVYHANLPNLFGLDLSELRFLPKLLSFIGLYILSTFTFSAMYTFIPATYVKYRNAIKSAALTAIVFVIFQYLYLETQFFVGRLSIAYGVIAAIPLFLMWLNFSWQIIILGAELTYGFQNLDNYKPQHWDS